MIEDPNILALNGPSPANGWVQTECAGPNPIATTTEMVNAIQSVISTSSRFIPVPRKMRPLGADFPDGLKFTVTEETLASISPRDDYGQATQNTLS
jgi:hypothetical protein